MPLAIRRQRDPNPKDHVLIRKDTSTDSTFAAWLSYKGLFLGLGLLCLLLIAKYSVGVFGMRSSPRSPRARQPNTQVTPNSRLSTEVTFGRDDLGVCPLGGFTGAHEYLISNLTVYSTIMYMQSVYSIL